MLFVYNLGIKIYFFLILIFSSLNNKARAWINGRKKIFSRIQPYTSENKPLWFHFASLGEFEQGRPVLESMKTNFPNTKIVVTFFSPSGYEIRKNYPLADQVLYLPLDTAKNAQKFVDMINPAAAIFTKYEYWYHYFSVIASRSIPLYMISTIYRPDQPFFKWYGSLHRGMLKYVTHFFVQDKESSDLLKGLGFGNVTVSGDTRFDRVFENKSKAKRIDVVEQFCAGAKVFVGGSTWPPDEQLLKELSLECSDWRFVIAPHEIKKKKIDELENLFGAEQVLRFSDIKTTADIPRRKVLIIDNIGMLSSLYQYADIAFIGGGFGAGIHNTLEAAAFGKPVIFGPNYQKFLEAKELIAAGAAFSVRNAKELIAVVRNLEDNNYRREVSEKAGSYVAGKVGATEIITSFIESDLKVK